jgi:enoyl-CoA hydratase/carnithine racemase
LDPGGPFRDRVHVAVEVRTERPGTAQREHRRCHRGVVQSVVECVAETWRLDIGQCLARGLANPRGVVHRWNVATEEPKTFGKWLTSDDMIRTADDGAVRTVTLARPDRRNALRPDDLDALEAAVLDAPAPVVYLRGAGSSFCAGADLDAVAALDDPEAFARQGQRVAATLAESDSVVVAGVDGAARGGGVELALACDLRIATPRATFGEPGVRFGLFGAWGGTIRLPDVLGAGEALDFALSGRVVDAEEALRMGLVSRVVDDPQAVADDIARGAPDALAVVKARVRDRSNRRTQERAEAKAFGDLHRAHADDIAASRTE